MTDIRFKLLNENAIMPSRATEGSAGYDIYALESYTVPINGEGAISTGITAEFPSSVELSIRGRSGLRFKKKLEVFNGLIDSDYAPGEIMLLVKNISGEVYRIEKGDRIAQGVFQPILLTADDSASGTREGGLGHTGK